MSETQPSIEVSEPHVVRGPGQLRWGTLVIVLVWTALLALGSWVLPLLLSEANTVSYNLYGAVRNHAYAIRMILFVVGPLYYIAPVVLGAIARTWRGALAFTLVPVWLALLPSLGTAFAGAIPGSIVFGAGPVHLVPATSALWLNPSQALIFVSASAVFGLLGSIGWLARSAWTGELRQS